VLKDSTQRQVINAIREVLSGDYPLDRNLSMQLIRRLATEATREAGAVRPLAHPLLSERPRPDSSTASGVSILSPRKEAALAITKAETGVVMTRNPPMSIAL
jgi:hypothetical protein